MGGMFSTEVEKTEIRFLNIRS